MTPGHDAPPTPALPRDPVIEAYKTDVDRTLLRENLKLSVAQRLENLQAFMRALAELHGAAIRR